MLRPLSEFIAALRSANLRISPAEAIDAYRTVAIVGFSDRATVRDSLCAALAKSPEEVRRFDECFDLFFKRDRPDAQTAEQSKPRVMSGAEASMPHLAELMLAGDADALAMEMEAAGARARISEIRHDFQRSVFVGRLLREMGLPAVDNYLAARTQGGGDGKRDLPGDGLAEARERLVADARRWVDRQRALFASETAARLRDERLTNTPIGKIAPHEMAEMRRLVRRMAKRLAERHSRRRLRAQQGHIDVRGTIRRSMAYGGVPFRPVWRRRAITRPSIVAICDVSRSVAASAQFLILFLHCLHDAIDHLDSFAFSDRLSPIGDILDNEDAADAIEETLLRSGFRSTDYGRAFQDFVEDHFDCVDRRTTVIVLGDARTNGGNPRLDLVGQIEARARGVIWLNPEDEGSWGVGDSEMPAYRRFCRHALHCGTLSHLERVIDEVLMSYR